MANHELNHTVSSSSRECDPAPHADARHNGPQYHAEPEDQIRMRAYELYVERGMRPSDGLGDWLEAEREFHARS